MIYIILGTRAQLVKMAPIIREIEKRHWPLKLFHTGQHKHSIELLAADFEISSNWQTLYAGQEVNNFPKAALWLMRIAYLILFNIDDYFPSQRDNKKDIVLVHGDTLSTLLGAIIGKKSGIPVAHIESGLRSFNLLNPFPEELIRLLTFRLTNLAFCPGSWAFGNMQKYKKIECIDTLQNTLIDSLDLALNHIKNNHAPSQAYGICSIHRFENVYNIKRFKEIIRQIELAAQRYKIIFVLHPVTLKKLNALGIYQALNENPNIQLQDRCGYYDFINLIRQSKFVITDGGSNQEELAYLGVPVFLMRKNTERQEGLATNVVIGHYQEQLLHDFLNHLARFRKKIKRENKSPTQIILDRLEEFTSK